MVIDLECGTERATSCAAKFGVVEFGYWAGFKYDLGKLHLEFHSYRLGCRG